MECLQQLMLSEDWDGLMSECCQKEIEACTTMGHAMPELYKVSMLSCLLANNLNECRFIYKRIPEHIQTADAEIAAIWNVGRVLWRRHYEDVYKTISEFQWSNDIEHLMMKLIERIRRDVFLLLTKAYSTIHVERAASMLGSTPEQVLATVTSCENAWKFNEESRLLIPKQATKPIQHIGLEQLRQLTNFAVHLESA